MARKDAIFTDWSTLTWTDPVRDKSEGKIQVGDMKVSEDPWEEERMFQRWHMEDNGEDPDNVGPCVMSVIYKQFTYLLTYIKSYTY